MAGIDLHTHLAPVLTDVAALPGIEPDGGRLVVDGSRVGLPRLYQPEALEAWLADLGLEAGAVSAPPPFFRQHLGEEETVVWVRALNDGILQATEGRPTLLPMAYLPLDRPEAAAAELERLLAEDAGWVGFAASAGGGSVSLADGSLDPVWELLAADGRPLLLHPGASPDPRLKDFYLANLLGNPYETGVAVAQLLFGDVPGRFPGVRFLLVHCGGVLTSVLGRWQRGIDTERPGLPTLTTPLSEAIDCFYVDCLAHDSAVVDLAVATFGGDRIVLGSDWPFPMGSDDPASLVAHLDGDLVRRISEENARALLSSHRVKEER
ncbi:aminocarboxymuconate-semialdehyde decarboxylase [Actinocorallia herbida]|uniref:Aminocarboxymuconate-semialdehyde decarboxylase n=1 Tax=Actinocorallia herbida TaxID=58109 RepID=A0A3N1CQR3_9ACTN|nr:amidohydrolase family protein [Actinocorallia herbida]ROO83068.1 aminocarboxymuconate-semialdehyde decarboxylase [Actinocorallia herbida]